MFWNDYKIVFIPFKAFALGMNLALFYSIMVFNRFNQLKHLTQSMATSDALCLPKVEQSATF